MSTVSELKTSVIINVYKRYQYLPFALESVFTQSVKPNEVIVIADDPDKVPYRDKVYVIESKDEKYGTKIIEGFRASTGDLIFFLEDDDLFHKDKVKIVKEIFQSKKDVVAVHNLQEYIDTEGNVVMDHNRFSYYITWQPTTNIILNKQNILKIYKQYPLLHHNVSSMTIRRDVIENNRQIFNRIELSPDFVCFITALREGQLLHIADKLTLYRLGAGNSQFSKGNYKQIKSLFCIWNRFALDLSILYEYVKGDPVLRKLVLSQLAIHSYTVWIISPYSTHCKTTYEISTSDMLKIIWSSLYEARALMRRRRTIKYLILLGFISMSPLVKRKRIANWWLKRRGFDPKFFETN